jgi:hypothetical protein
MTTESVWAPQSCTLAGADLTLRVAEFDDLFATALRDFDRLGRLRLRLVLDPSAEPATRDLLARESECCSFFTFTLSSGDDSLAVDVEVPPSRADVLDALAVRAAAMSAASG